MTVEKNTGTSARFNLLPKKFSLRDLQNLYEAILDTKMDRRNFRKKFFAIDFLINMREMEQGYLTGLENFISSTMKSMTVKRNRYRLLMKRKNPTKAGFFQKTYQDLISIMLSFLL